MIETIIEFFLHLDEHLAALIQSYGNFVYLLVFLVIFVETGLVVMPFLPGDSLLFITGTIAAASTANVYLLFLLFSVAAVLGDTVNYWLGHYFGEKVFSKFINRNHLEKTKLFFRHYGKKTIVLARFVPIVRTFAPFVAGIGKMEYSVFLSYNFFGGVFWVALFVFSGYFFGNIPLVKDNLTVVVLLIIIVSLIPALLEYIKHKIKNRKNIELP